MAITLDGTNGITTPAVTNNGAYTGDGISFADGTPSNTLVTTTGGNVGIGTSSPSKKLSIVGSTTGSAEIVGSAYSELYFVSSVGGSSNGAFSYDIANNALRTYTAGSERMRIDSSGNLLVGTTTQPSGFAPKVTAFQSAADYSVYFGSTQSTAGNCYGAYIKYENASPNGNGNAFLVMKDNSGDRAYFRSNGGLVNYQANNANISDIRAKTDINLASNYLDKICAIPVKTFKYKDQTDNELNLGVIAQEVEAVAPELVDVSGFGETLEDGTRLKAIYQTDLQYALMKCIQELKAELDTVKSELSALKGVA